MTTTKEFKTLHSLSDSAFTRLVNKIKAEYPDQELTRRVGSKDWKIIDVALFEQYLSYQKRESSLTKQDEGSESTAIAIPTSSIQVLNPDQTNTLDLLAEKYAIKPFKPVQLNGSQESALDIVQKLAATTEAMEAENERLAQELADREAKNEALQNVVKGIGKKMRGQFEVNASLQEKAEKVEAQDSELKKQLAELLKSLQ